MLQLGQDQDLSVNLGFLWLSRNLCFFGAIIHAVTGDLHTPYKLKIPKLPCKINTNICLDREFGISFQRSYLSI